jgi:hypothetical protein
MAWRLSVALHYQDSQILSFSNVPLPGQAKKQKAQPLAVPRSNPSVARVGLEPVLLLFNLNPFIW